MNQPAEEDLRPLGLFAAIASLGYMLWIVGAMEMVERLAFYGVKAVSTIYAKTPVSEGGLGITLASYGVIQSAWAATQNFVPAFTGGLSDRYGYKETIAASTVVKIAGYLVMGFFPTYAGFFAGVMLLALGTAIFKPGIQGTLANITNRSNSSVAWAIFYQTVNIGGYIGPLLAGLLRKMDWSFVFFACALIISCNFLLLLTYRESGREERLARLRDGKQESLVSSSLRELVRPQVALYVLIFSGFWFMFMALFDILPAYIEDWVDTRPIVDAVVGAGGQPGALLSFFVILSKDGQEILPEGLLNVNAGLIMVTCFVFGALSARLRATTSMVIGTLLASAAMFVFSASTAGWLAVGAIAVFAVGEMLSSPKFNEYIGNVAPSDKKAMYLGFAQLAIGFGWTAEGFLGPWMYDQYASKERFARQALVEHGWTADAVAAVPQGEAFGKLVEALASDKWTVTQQLYAAHADSIPFVWDVMGGVGLASALGIFIYGWWTRGR